MKDAFPTASLKLVVSIALCWFVPVASVFAQTGVITGVVTDAESGTPLPGVNVVIEGTMRGASTDTDGTYVIEDLEPGSYSLRASYIGYTDQLVENVPVRAGETTTRNFQLGSATGKMDEIVVIGYGEQSRVMLTTA